MPVRKRIHCGTCRFCFCFFARIFFTRTAHAAEQLFSPAAKRSSAPKEDSGQLSQDGRGAGRINLLLMCLLSRRIYGK